MTKIKQATTLSLTLIITILYCFLLSSMDLSRTTAPSIEQNNSISAHILLSYLIIILVFIFVTRIHVLKISLDYYVKCSYIFISLIIIVTTYFNLHFFKKSLTSDQAQIVKLNAEFASLGDFFNCKVNCYPSFSNIFISRFIAMFNDDNTGYNLYTIFILTLSIILTYYFWSKLYTGFIVGVLTFMPLPIIMSLERIENTFSVSVLTPLLLILNKTNNIFKSGVILFIFFFGLQFNPQVIMYMIPVLILILFKKSIFRIRQTLFILIIIILSIYLQRDYFLSQVVKQIDFGSGYIPSINFKDYYGYEATRNKSLNDVWSGIDLNILKNHHMGNGFELQNYLIILGSLTIISLIYFLSNIEIISKANVQILFFVLVFTILARLILIREYYFTDSYNLWPRSTLLIQYIIFIILVMIVFEYIQKFVKYHRKNNISISFQKLQKIKLATNLCTSAIIVYQLAYIYW
jgi:hypothetical protein